jgi:phospholipase/carboxylesterase
MTALPQLAGPVFGPVAKGKAGQFVVLLHGVGADGNDLIGLAPEFARVLPHAAFSSPHAPYPCDFAPQGRQWFSLMDRGPQALLAGVKSAAPVVNAFLDSELAKFGLDDSALALIGFSQGTMVALYTALRRAKPCAAVLGYSGALLGAETLFTEIVSRPPVLLIHGDQDPVVPFAALGHAETVLLANAVPVETQVRKGLGHGIDGEGFALGARFLAKAFGAKPAGRNP